MFVSHRGGSVEHTATGDYSSEGDSHEITGLTPGTQYSIRVEVSSGDATETPYDQMYATSMFIPLAGHSCATL